MQFYIPPHRARAIWQEYLNRQAVERRNRLEMAKRIMTWYNDLESEVAEHFQKALHGSAAKRRRLIADDPSPAAVPSPLFSSDNCGSIADFDKTRSWQAAAVHTPSLPHRLPSLFPHVPGLPQVTMTYPDYYHYTSEVDPFSGDISPATTEDFDFPLTNEDQFTLNHDQVSHELRNGEYNWIQTLISETPHLPAPHPGEIVWPVDLSLPHHQTSYDTNFTVFCDMDAHYLESILPTSVDSGAPHLDLGPGVDSLSFSSSPDAQFPMTTTHRHLHRQFEAHVVDAFSPSPFTHFHDKTASHGDSNSSSDCNLPLDFTISATAAETDDVMGSEDDIIDNIRLDWTEEEKVELRTIAV